VDRVEEEMIFQFPSITQRKKKRKEGEKDKTAGAKERLGRTGESGSPPRKRANQTKPGLQGRRATKPQGQHKYRAEKRIQRGKKVIHIYR